MKFTIITVGSKPDPELTTLIDGYTKRFPKNIQIDWKFIKNGAGDAKTSMQTEAESILKAIPKRNRVVVLDETGQQKTSPDLANSLFNTNKNTTFIIGGAYGIHNDVKAASDELWSLGWLVYPHQLVRLILTEQIYRAFTIHTNHPYHH